MTGYLIELPAVTRTGRAFRFRANLSGVQYRLNFEFNVRDSSWYFHLLDAGNVPIFHGVRVQVGVPALTWLTDPRKPAGNLCFVDTSGKKLDPGQTDMGGRVVVMYDDLIEAG